MVLDSLSTPWRRGIALVVFALLLHVGGTHLLPLIDRDEPRFAEATREMLERSDFLVPHFNNGYRFDKPILIYWCQAASVKLFGEGEFAVRFPSALAAALTAGVLYGFGRRAAGEAVGIWAALIFTTSLQTLVHAKMAVADFVLILFMTLATWAGWELMQLATAGPDAQPSPSAARAGRRSWWWTFYVSLALAFLAKGPLGWLPYLSVVLMSLRQPSIRRVIRPWTGLAVMLLLVGLWGIPALWVTDGAYFWVGIGRHVVQRSVGTLEGHGASHLLGYIATLPLYFITIFPSFFPWSCFLPLLVRNRWRASSRGPLECYLVTGILLNFGIFSLIRTKLPHYTLPCFPLLSLGLAWWWHSTGRNDRPLKRALGAGTALAVLASWLLIPFLAPLLPSEQLYDQSRAWLRPTMEFASVDYDEPSLVWAFRRRVHGWHHPVSLDELAPFMDQPGPRFCILPTKQIPEAWESVPPEWKHWRTEGFNAVHGRKVDLTLLLKPE